MASSRVSKAGSVLSELMQRLEFRERLREYSLWNVWDEAVGEILAARAEPLRIEDGRLFVRVADSSWMQELHYLKDEIRDRLNQALGAPIVRDLYLVLGNIRRTTKPDRSIPVHPVDEEAVAALVPDTQHPGIEAALRRVARAHARRLGPGAIR